MTETEKKNMRRCGFSLEKDGEHFCPVCEVKLKFARHFVGMMDPYRIGNEGDIYYCPECGYEFSVTTIWRD